MLLLGFCSVSGSTATALRCRAHGEICPGSWLVMFPVVDPVKSLGGCTKFMRFAKRFVITLMCCFLNRGAFCGNTQVLPL